ncbi:hypothetical protein NQ318_023592 [Aromia moschata]|uniref:Reverse transcriptase zinc-binding domain-containing protein n=1 Tax=Aromia moschata TaxID=1265417 RepID=A0AAV8YRC3_9CUCU|nr:hypothetical protein NQ318_023592 [Aromia moschata]
MPCFNIRGTIVEPSRTITYLGITIDWQVSFGAHVARHLEAYTQRIGKSADAKCLYCKQEDTVRHTVFDCEMWAQQRQEAEAALGAIITPENLIDHMLENPAKWRIHGFMTQIMQNKELDERRVEEIQG